MNKQIEKLIKKSQHRSKFYKQYKSRSKPVKSKDDKSKLNRFLYNFLYRVLISSMILLLLLISKKDDRLSFIHKQTFSHLNFALIDNFVTKELGSIFPKLNNDKIPVNNSYISLDNSEKYSEGLVVTTSPFEPVQSHIRGIVIKKYYDELYGNSVIIQDEFGREFHYGYLEDVSVNLYGRISYGQSIGVGRLSEDMSEGSYYLAIKNGDNYMDVYEVVSDEN